MEKKLQQNVSQLGNEKDQEINELHQRIEELQHHIENMREEQEGLLFRAENDKQKALLIGLIFFLLHSC